MLAVGVGLCCALLAGCEQQDFELAPVRGVVTIDGRPLTVGTIMFSPQAAGEGGTAGQPAFGQIQSDGTFQLATYGENDGAIVGEHWATIVNNADKGSQATAAPNRRFKRLAVPQVVQVVAGEENNIPIKLTSQDVAKFGSKD